MNRNPPRPPRSLADLNLLMDHTLYDDSFPRECIVCGGPMGGATGLGCEGCRVRYEEEVRPKVLRGEACRGGGKYWLTARDEGDEAVRSRGWREDGVRAMEDGRS